MKVPVLVAAEGATWEAALVTAFERDDHGVGVVRRCVDVVEMLAVAATGQARAVLVASGLRRFDAAAVDQLQASGVRPVGVVARGDVTAEDRLRSIGVDHIVPEDAEPAVVASVLLDAVSRPVDRASTRRSFTAPIGGPGDDEDATPATDTGEGVDGGLVPRAGSVLAVWGPTGAPGRTTLAVTLADEIARLGASVLLVDADVYGGVIAAHLGVLDEAPGLAAACRAASGSRLDAEGLARLCWQVVPGLRVLTGIALAQRWPEIRATALESVLAAARTLADYTIVDCGFAVETDEEISFDSLAPRRNGATLTVLDVADSVLVIGSGDPIGVQRLVRALTDLTDAEVATPTRIVVNKVRKSVTGGEPRAAASAALQRFAGRNADALLPYDRDAVDAALLSGRTLAECAPNSPLRREVVELARAVTGIRSRSSRRRRGG